MAFLTQLYRTQEGKNRGPFIIVAPLSLINQWQGEAGTWAPDLNVLVYHGNTDSRQVLRDYEFHFDEPYIRAEEAHYLKQRNILKFDILLTTYETVIKDIKILSRIMWKVLVVDEAHRLKNPASRLFVELRTLPREHCVLLTGTPLQNKTEELWALLNFADPVHFGDQAGFSREYGDLKDASQVENLHNMLKPFLLRRIKEDVEKSLPPKEETIVEVSLTPLQRKFYMAIYDRNTAFLFKESKASMAPSLMNVMMELRKCCNHAYLNRGVEERILSEIPLPQRTPENLHHQLVSCSGKMVLLDKLLPRLKKEGHKVLIFSQMVRVLDLVEDYMRYVGHSYERLDGTKKATERSAAVVRFNNPALNRFVMLLSTRAGGLGLNLTAADTVIIYDSDWNPHNDLQAQARAHRIGQTKAVKVYRLLTRKSYEIEMFHAASMKLGLDRAVLAHQRAEGEMEANSGAAGRIDGVGPSDSASSLLKPSKAQLGFSHMEVEHLLKRGAYDVFRGDDAEGQEFQEADIDQILKRQSHKVVYGNQDSLTKNLASSFSKASFVSVDNKKDIDLDDPDFWKKAIGLAEPAQDAIKATSGLATSAILGEGEKRKRKRNERFDPKTLAGLEESLEGYDSAFEGQSFEDDSGGEAASQSGSSEAQPRRRGRPRKGEIVRVRGRTRRRGKSEGNEATVGNGRFSVGPDGRVISGTGVDGSNASTSPTTQLRRAPKWGPHSRDRLIRALLEFGFGRWKRIRSESLASDVPLGEVESFCRSYVLQCGLCAGEGKRARQESKFVKDAIAAATKLAAQMKSGEIVIPEVLQDERFLSRLRQGMARKALVRLDLLLRLQTPIMNDAVRLAYMALSPKALTAKGLPDNLSEHPEQLVSRMPNFEDRFQNLGREEVAAHILLGEVRPSWTQVTPWWDLECDKHLLLGVYMHGFQNYNAIRDDPNLCFRRKMEAWLVDNPKGFMLETKPPPLASNAKEQSLSRDFTWSPLQIFLRLPRRLAQAKENESSEAGNGGDAGAKEEGETSEEAACREYFRAVTLPGKRVSGYRGVYAQPGSVHWVVQIQQLTGTQCVGYFASEKKAALAYDAAARRLYGPDADTNFTSEADASSVAASTASTTQLQPRASSSDPAASPLSPAAAVQGGEASSDSPPMIASSASMISVDSVDKEEEVLRRRPEVTKLPDHELPLSWHRSSRYRGVRAAGPKWTAQISYNGQNHHLGTFNSELEAALAYDALSRRYHVGQMAVLNFPDGPEEELNRIDALMEELTAKKLPGGWPQGGAEEAAAVAATTIALEQAKLEKVTGRNEKENRATEEEENAAIEEVVVSNEQKEGGQISRMEEEGVKSMKEEMPVEGTAEGATCDGDRVGKKEVKLEDVQSQGAEKEEESNDVRMKSSAEEETGAAAVKGALSDMKAEKPEGSAAGTAPVVPERAAENVSKEGLSVEKMEASECEKTFARPDGTKASASREADYGEEKPEKGIGERSKPAVIGRATPEVDGPEDEAKEKKDEEKVGENDLQETDKAREEASQDGSLAVGESMKKKVETAELDGTAVKATGDQALESMIKKFWPDGYKILSKLVTWLIDDPEARLSHSDLKLQTSGEGFRVDASGRPIKRRPSEEDERGFGGANTGDPIHKKMKPSPGSLRGSGAWSTEECRRLCNALLMSGAPLSSPPLPVTLFLATAGKLSESVLVGRTSPSAAHSVDQVIGHLPTFTWEDVRVRANLPNKAPEELQAFYVTQLLPLFQKLCTHREPLPEAGEGLSTIPDPTKGVLEHTAGSRSIAYTFMRRQQLIRAVRYILEKKPRRLVEYLGSAEGKAAGRSLPGWWQGTRHDVALMLGSWWKGLLCIDHIRRETKLGLCDAAIFAHLKKAVNEKATATDRPQPSEAELQDYSERALAAFPDRKTLEERLHRICIVIARNVPAGADLRTMGARAKSPSSDFSGGLTTVLPVPGHEKEGSEGKENGGVLNEGVETKIVRESPGGTTTLTSPTSVVTATPSPKGHEAMGAVGTSISSAPGEL
ncbi:myb domain-containing protein [Nannochloropsis gaditana]|uniref:Myb domain-containing protein n=1 Tax=Nannochloropsis gaditana TaxID=72520 RepID=W7U0D9_9STRA|nr:myb domain-containing protein [Nannochloropsis gaditana]